MNHINDYKQIVGGETILRIKKKAKRLRGKHIVMVSSTHHGGGVAEILNSIIFLFNDLGVECGWRIIHGTSDFFSITKKLHNDLQGEHLPLTDVEREHYLETNKRFCVFTHLRHHDLVVVHDPQPAPLVLWEKSRRQPWIWRCHLDLSHPDSDAWAFLRPIVNKYSRVVVSHEGYKQEIKPLQRIIHPAIDPLSIKNKPLSQKEMHQILKEYDIDSTRPFIAQVSRFDAWKDPEGVIRVFERVKHKVSCDLVLLGNTANDDPEGVEMYNRIKSRYGRRKNIHLLVDVPNGNRVVNTIQTLAQVVIQKSIREGFGLTVSEALYKGTPVVGSNVGGIPLQVIDNASGFLHDPRDEQRFADSVIKLLKDRKLRTSFGKRGSEYIRTHFLMPRLIEDWLDLFIEVLC